MDDRPTICIHCGMVIFFNDLCWIHAGSLHQRCAPTIATPPRRPEP